MKWASYRKHVLPSASMYKLKEVNRKNNTIKNTTKVVLDFAGLMCYFYIPPPGNYY